MMQPLDILVCEDEAIVARDLEKRLEDYGHHVTAMAQSGEDAISLADKVRPQLALMDIRLSGPMDGVQTAKILQDRYGIPSIYLTAYCDEKTLNAAKATQPLSFLSKPVHDSDLKAAIEVGMNQARRERELLTALRKGFHGQLSERPIDHL